MKHLVHQDKANYSCFLCSTACNSGSETFGDCKPEHARTSKLRLRARFLNKNLIASPRRVCLKCLDRLARLSATKIEFAHIWKRTERTQRVVLMDWNLLSLVSFADKPSRAALIQCPFRASPMTSVDSLHQACIPRRYIVQTSFVRLLKLFGAISNAYYPS